MIVELVNDLKNKNLEAEEYVERTYEKIGKYDKYTNAFITIRSKEEVLREVKENINKGGKLAGILIAIKDNISTKGIRTTCASKMLEDYIPPYDATVIEKLKKEGAVIVGKTNMDEFAMGSTTETSYFGPTRNPWNLERTPGGSSGGSGAALAAGYVELALGSDTGGSIRAPAAYNATFGLKPSYGTVSRFGLVAYANSLEQIGPMARNAEDLGLLFSIIAGPDDKDATTIDLSLNFEFKEQNVKSVRIGILSDILEMSEKPVSGVIKDVIDKLSSEGALIEDTKLGNAEYALPAYYIIAMSEASSNLARYDGVRYGYSKYMEGNWREVYAKNRGEAFGIEVKRRILLGSFILSAGYYEEFYLKALKVRNLIKKSLDELFKKYDILVSPTMPILPPKIGEVINDPVRMYAMDLNTVIANLAAIPALSLPAGFYNDLPIGLQLMGKYLSDIYLINISSYIERNVTKLYNLTAPIKI
ncbi:glutamyl-tRNA(Gln) amidotransferase, A subunit [Sulfolobus islandicus Y.G.57.14]|uniref:Glutamyl-tRNA(Gln) amidotransferase subunit A n=4 Tax=Saccharolobus islandicus TaxID=43080 RepID=C3MPQ1_SACI2|nr:Asp-tRNA(Asn)/Glu-tRNA(Gln) amidotransferase subunit GatA [Sulfolobus islandicus]ACP35364.1 glutamyl-tRNA(Gln) amidotransferase, A subunit [Sulfolobus islandicus L.S.2.15]ACP45520.1 glutamyl-tRNA(Gln) amidotransferase, A subunit [Sulfolobus islandicus Y.G.57.14]ADX82563.1 glutamyl-tRNA(Gln) amidotransferase, A subunit [Sulfolobus islandicus HVE10/4]ADX85199.1 glutamyl-tRNA(Gln) amidotransferase, A subunit [Sulfolobus islandicus REY15A]PVU78695.1 Asp-tRNA(Asn)/Glu-tRNA(Gln) amidotransferase 